MFILEIGTSMSMTLCRGGETPEEVVSVTALNVDGVRMGKMVCRGGVGEH
jgi:hypothetical protein